MNAARQFLTGLDLNDLKGMNLSLYAEWLNKVTCKLKDRFPASAKKWGTARKALNVFLCHAYLNRELSETYGLKRFGNVMETPLDSLAANKLRESAGTTKLPRWLGVCNLTPEMSIEYQDYALEFAEQIDIPRACLDIILFPKKLNNGGPHDQPNHGDRNKPKVAPHYFLPDNYLR